MSSGMGNTAQNDALLLFINTSWANLGDVTGVRGSTTAWIAVRDPLDRHAFRGIGAEYD